jgi:hypothetical protein
MMKWTSICLVASILLMLVTPSQGSSWTEMQDLLDSMNDPYMTEYDIAFVLVTHGYDAIPMDNYVELKMDSGIFQLELNGDQPGQASLILN